LAENIFKSAIIGKLNREFVIPLSGTPIVDGIGGNLLYAASGYALWGEGSNLVAKIGEDYPAEWLEKIRNFGFNTSGLKTSPENIDHRFFCAFQDSDEPVFDSPIAHFARIEFPYPNALLGYNPGSTTAQNPSVVTPFTILKSDIPLNYLDGTALHLCPVDFITHSLIPSVFRQGNVTTITIDPSTKYMTPTCWDLIPSVVNNITAFLVSERKIQNLFKGRTTDLWEMAECIAGFGCEIVAIKRGLKGQYLYEAATRNRWILPAYPAKVLNPLGAGDAFSGGFLFGYTHFFDPLEAALYGNISASMVIEGDGPFFALDSLPGLAQARMETFRDQAVKI